jgi:hypothetical protein
MSHSQDDKHLFSLVRTHVEAEQGDLDSRRRTWGGRADHERLSQQHQFPQHPGLCQDGLEGREDVSLHWCESTTGSPNQPSQPSPIQQPWCRAEPTRWTQSPASAKCTPNAHDSLMPSHLKECAVQGVVVAAVAAAVVTLPAAVAAKIAAVSPAAAATAARRLSCQKLCLCHN